MISTVLIKQYYSYELIYLNLVITQGIGEIKTLTVSQSYST